jgi:hypothetical protein
MPNQFAYYIGGDQGSIIFGGHNRAYQLYGEEEPVWLPIKEHYYWTLILKDVRKETAPVSRKIRTSTSKDTIQLCPQGCNGVLDTGTFLIYGPRYVVEDYFGQMQNDCKQKHLLPNLVFAFQQNDTTIEVVLTPEDYVIQFDLNGQEECVIGITSDDSDDWTFGQVFFRQFYTLFNRDKNAIGLLESKHSTKHDATRINNTSTHE